MRSAYGPATTTTAADLTRNFGQWQERALSGPVFVTYHGRPRVVVLSADQYNLWTEATPDPAEEPAVAEVEAGFVAVLNHMEEAFLALDEHMTVIAMNTHAETYFGIPSAKLLGMSIVHFFPGLVGSVLHDKIARALRSGLADRFEAKSVAFPDRTIMASVFPYPGGAGITFANITEEVATSERLRRADALFAALDCTEEASFLGVNVRGTIEEVGHRFAKIVGIQCDKIRGARISDFVALSERRELAAMVDALLSGGEKFSKRVTVLTAGQDGRPARISVAPLRGQQICDGAFALINFERPN